MKSGALRRISQIGRFGLGALLLASCAGERPSGRGPARASCPALPGAQALLARRGQRFIIFGEMHGTAEAPALFGDFVCLAAARGPVVVGLEMEQDQQESLDTYLASDGAAPARAALLANRHWMRGRDGRASVAMLALVERVRQLRSAGRDIRLLAFLRRVADRSSQTPHERAMAAAWRESLEGRRGARLVALVGNVHARREPAYGFEPAAMHMPAGETLTIGFAPLGGTAWNCQRNGCGPHRMAPETPIIARGIAAPPGTVPATPGYDRWISAGAPFTASPPVAGAGDPVPARSGTKGH